MALLVKWYNSAETILHFKYYGDFTTADLHFSSQEKLRLIQNHQGQFHIISDYRNIKINYQLPQGVLNFIKRDNSLAAQEGQHFIVVNTSVKTLARSMLGLVRSIRPELASKIQLCDSFEEALALCEKLLEPC